MTVEEKLSHFFDSSVSDARKQSEAAIEEYRENLEKDFEDFKANIDLLASDRLKIEETRIRREMNHDLSTSLIQVRKELRDKHDELKNAIFAEVKQLLDTFRHTEEYHLLIEKHIKNALEFAREDLVTIYLDPADENLLSDLTAKFDCRIVTSDYSFGGGTRAVINEKNILIDHSFDTKFNEILEDYTFNGGGLHE